MAVLKINNKWYSMDNGIKAEAVIPLEHCFMQKEKNLLIGFAAHKETIYPVIGFCENKRDTAILISLKDSAPFAIIIDDISFDDNMKGEADLSGFLKENIHV